MQQHCIDRRTETAVDTAVGNVRQAALSVPIPIHYLKARLQDARLRRRPQGTPAQRCQPEPSEVGILRSVPDSQRYPVSIHPIHQIFRRLSSKGKYHHTLET